MEHPDKWIVVKIEPFDGSGNTHYRVFASYYGGYTGGDSWRLNSGISSVEVENDFFLFHGFSGSVYKCHKDCYGTSGYGYGVLQNLKANSKSITLTEMASDTNWLELNYG